MTTAQANHLQLKSILEQYICFAQILIRIRYCFDFSDTDIVTIIYISLSQLSG